MEATIKTENNFTKGTIVMDQFFCGDSINCGT
jgi:hypothetical protein